MSVYISSINSAVYLFPLFVLVLSLPIFILVYRRHGNFALSRGIVLYTFMFYMLCTYFLVILPLPPVEEVASYTQPSYNLVPFNFVGRFISSSGLVLSDTSTYIPALCSNAFLEPVFNVFLTMPFGIYLRYYFKQPLKKTILFSFLLSLFFELTQLSGLYFIYPRPYRLADVNDLITNTTGGLIGHLIAPTLTRLLPARHSSSHIHANGVSLMRRACALAVDWIVIYAIEWVASFIFGISSLQGWESPTVLLKALLYFVLLQYALKGKTPGKALLRIKTTATNGGSPSLKQLFMRYAPMYIVIAFIVFLSSDLPLANTKNGGIPIWGSAIAGMICIALQLTSIIVLLYYFISRRTRYVHERFSDTYTVAN